MNWFQEDSYTQKTVQHVQLSQGERVRERQSACR